MKKEIKRDLYRINFGKWGEDCACNFLTQQGLALIDRNIRTPFGEIDLVMTSDNLTVFVEVKSRTNTENGYPEEAITDDKMDHMNESAEWYLENHPDIADSWRVDVVTVIGKINQNDPQIDWFQSEF